MNTSEVIAGLGTNELSGFNLTMSRETVCGAIALGQLDDEILNEYIYHIDEMYFSEHSTEVVDSIDKASQMIFAQLNCIFDNFDFDKSDIAKNISAYTCGKDEIDLRQASKYTIHDLIGLYISK